MTRAAGDAPRLEGAEDEGVGEAERAADASPLSVPATHLPPDLDRLCAALGADLHGAQNAVQMLRTGDHDSPHGGELVEDLVQWGVEIAAGSRRWSPPRGSVRRERALDAL